MGIPQFLNSLKSNYGQDWLVSNIAKKWNYLILDFQSIIWNIDKIHSSELNFLIRLLKLYQLETNKREFLNYHIIKIIYIVNNYKNYLISCKPDLEADINKFVEKHQNLDLNDFLNKLYQIELKLNWENYLVNKVVEYVIDLSNTYIDEPDKYSRTFIFFDGIPSYSKIKEQVLRRIYPEILNAIKNDILDNPIIKGDSSFEKEYLSKKVGMESVGPGSNLSKNIRTKLNEVNDSIKGKFNINSDKIIGEAEHQIMKYLQSNATIFESNQILLASPDADLILLSFINKMNNFNIDLLQITSISEDNYTFKLENYDDYNEGSSPFKITKEFIIIDRLLFNMKLDDYQQIIDLSFILLLLGDDFLPKIPTLSIDNLEYIVDKCRTKSYNIIKYECYQGYKIEYPSFLNFLKDLINNDKENEWDSNIVSKHNKKIDKKNFLLDNFKEYAEKLMLPYQTFFKEIDPIPPSLIPYLEQQQQQWEQDQYQWEQEQLEQAQFMQPQFGQDQWGQHQLGQDQWWQPQLEQYQWGQDQLGQDQWGQDQLGQDQLGQPQLGQDQFEQSNIFKYDPGSVTQYYFYDMKSFLIYFLQYKGIYFSIDRIEENYPPIRFNYYIDHHSNKIVQTENLLDIYDKVFKNRQKLFPIRDTDEDKIKNYLEGCAFILDIYLNNNLKNYEWFYKYDSSPTITEIVSFMEKPNLDYESVFDYVKNKNIFRSLKYLNVENYTIFRNQAKLDLITKIAKKIIVNTIDLKDQKQKLDELNNMDKNQILKTYFTYSNVKHIFNCLPESIHIDKCFEIELPITSNTDNILNTNGVLQIRKKYLKYKAKYLALKKKLK